MLSFPKNVALTASTPLHLGGFPGPIQNPQALGLEAGCCCLAKAFSLKGYLPQALLFPSSYTGEMAETFPGGSELAANNHHA